MLYRKVFMSTSTSVLLLEITVLCPVTDILSDPLILSQNLNNCFEADKPQIYISSFKVFPNFWCLICNCPVNLHTWVCLARFYPKPNYSCTCPPSQLSVLMEPFLVIASLSPSHPQPEISQLPLSSIFFLYLNIKSITRSWQFNHHSASGITSLLQIPVATTLFQAVFNFLDCHGRVTTELSTPVSSCSQMPLPRYNHITFSPKAFRAATIGHASLKALGQAVMWSTFFPGMGKIRYENVAGHSISCL